LRLCIEVRLRAIPVEMLLAACVDHIDDPLVFHDTLVVDLGLGTEEVNEMGSGREINQHLSSAGQHRKRRDGREVRIQQPRIEALRLDHIHPGRTVVESSWADDRVSEPHVLQLGFHGSKPVGIFVLRKDGIVKCENKDSALVGLTSARVSATGGAERAHLLEPGAATTSSLSRLNCILSFRAVLKGSINEDLRLELKGCPPGSVEVRIFIAPLLRAARRVSVSKEFFQVAHGSAVHSEPTESRRVEEHRRRLVGSASMAGDRRPPVVPHVIPLGVKGISNLNQ